LPLPVSPLAIDDLDSAEPAAPDPGYVGPQACAACHAARVAEFLKTSHYLACRLPRAETMPPGFASGRGTYVTRDQALRFEMSRIGAEFFQTAIRTTPSGVQRTSERVDLVYGSGGADEVYLTWHGDRLYELPMAWLHPQNQWGASPFDRYGPGEIAREMTTRCVECHNTWLEHVPGTANQYKRQHVILGVTCERCHGPGREHVAFHEAHPEADSGQAIVHPGRLTRELQLDVCSQCHSNATKPRGPAFSYRPGELLAASYRTTAAEHPENDHVANQIHYLRQSKCFQKNDTLTCTTCHNPHRPHGPANTASTQRGCLKCHKPADCGAQNRLPTGVRGDCVGCHMPEHIKINVSFHTETDEFVPPIRRHQHRIAIYPTGEQEVLLNWYRKRSGAPSHREFLRLQQELVKHWLSKAEDFRRAYRFLAATGAIREALRLDPSPATRAKLHEIVDIQMKLEAELTMAIRQIDARHYPEAIAGLQRALSIKPDLGLAHGKLGTVYALTGQRDLAVEHLRAAAKYDPDDAYGYSMLGWLAFRQDRAEEAVEDYRSADAVEPYNAKINYHWGLALMKLGRWEEAVACFRRVVAIDPHHPGGCQGLSHVLRQQGQPAEALRFARRAAQLTRYQNADVLITLAETYADVGRFAQARDIAAQALDAAQDGTPELVPQIRRRLDELRAHAK
jgi:tetratricopeptide (TPR) repeat protein